MWNSVLAYCLVLLCAAVRVERSALAQSRCTMETVAGTYALQAAGSSTILNRSTSVPGDPMHWAAQHAPLAAAGRVTVHPDGKADGYYWPLAGRLASGLTPVHWAGRISELDPDACIAIIDFGMSSSPAPVFGSKAVGFILDGGREWRTTAWETPIESAAWSGSMRLIGREPASSHSCGQQQIQGRYLLQCDGSFSWSGDTPFVSSSAVAQLDVDKTGGFRGTWFGRSGLFLVGPVRGSLKVNADCSLESFLVWNMFPGLTTTGRGVLFDGGGGAFLVFLEDAGLPPIPAKSRWDGACQLIRVER